jgi:hypothetical protein
MSHPVKLWACTSAGSCMVGFMDWFVHVSIPYLQWVALVIAVISGLRAFFHPSNRK